MQDMGRFILDKFFSDLIFSGFMYIFAFCSLCLHIVFKVHYYQQIHSIYLTLDLTNIYFIEDNVRVEIYHSFCVGVEASNNSKPETCSMVLTRLLKIPKTNTMSIMLRFQLPKQMTQILPCLMAEKLQKYFYDSKLFR